MLALQALSAMPECTFQFTILKCRIKWFCVFILIKLCSHHHCQISEHFHLLKRNQMTQQLRLPSQKPGAWPLFGCPTWMAGTQGPGHLCCFPKKLWRLKWFNTLLLTFDNVLLYMSLNYLIILPWVEKVTKFLLFQCIICVLVIFMCILFKLF